MTTTTEHSGISFALGLRVGELVEVRSEQEILATLDAHGELDSLPFMPEMLAFCGRRLTVAKVAHKVCDTITYGGMRKMDNAVHLVDARCDGSAHGGCQSACVLFFKEAWLKRVDSDSTLDHIPAAPPAGMTLPLLQITTRREPFEDGAARYACQATEVLRATPEPLPWRKISQFTLDLSTGNADLLSVIRAFLVGFFNRLQKASTRVLPRGLWFRGGLRWGFLEGKLTGRTPTRESTLQPGDLVRIKSREEILATLNKELLNRGMAFDLEMARYCGKTARVVRKVDRIIDEKTGRMLELKNPCIVLSGVVCGGVYNSNCPRAFYTFWRDVWLDRVE
jgi:hypothetical protein